MIQKVTLRATIRFNPDVPQWEVWSKRLDQYTIEISETADGLWRKAEDVFRGDTVLTAAHGVGGVNFAVSAGVRLTIETFVTIHTNDA